MSTRTSHRWAARAGLILGPLAWALNQQVTSTMIYSDCARGRTATVLASGVLCACLALLGLGLSWFARQGALAEHSSTQPATTAFTATLSTCAAAIFFLVIVAGTAAGFLLPGCYR